MTVTGFLLQRADELRILARVRNHQIGHWMILLIV